MNEPAPGRSRKALFLSLAALASAMTWLALRAAPRDWPQFFGLWGMGDFAIALALLWLSGAGLALWWKRAHLFRYLLATLLLVVTWLLLELVGFLGLLSYPEIFWPAGEGLGTTARPHLEESGVTSEDLAGRWGYPTEPIPFHFKTDRRGFRNDADRESADLYLLGDSILVAGLVPFASTVAALLERDLGLPVMNLALLGVGPQEEHALLVGAEVPLRDRLLLQFVFEGNDLKDSARHRHSAEGGTAPPPNPSLLFNLGKWLQENTQIGHPAGQRRIGRILDEDYLFAWTSLSFVGLEAEQGAICDSLGATRRVVETAGGRYGIIFVPAKIRVLGPHCTWPAHSSLQGHLEHLNPLRDHLREWCRAEGVPLLDLTAALEAELREGSVPWFRGDTHPNAAGHRAMAGAIGAWTPVQSWVEGR